MRLLIALVGLHAFAAPVVGCGVCASIRGDALSLPHPRAIELAVATRAALDKGLLPKVPESPGGWNDREKPSAAGLLRAWAERVNAEPRAVRGRFSIHVVLIDSSEAFAVHVRGGEYVLEARPAGGGDAVVATTIPALQSLLSGPLPWEQALQLKLVVLDGKQELARVLSSKAVR